MTATFAWVLVPTLLLLAAILCPVLVGQRTRNLDLRVRTPTATAGRRGMLINVVRTDRPGA